MEEFASSWSYQENIDELKQKLLYTTLELEAIKAETSEEIKRNTESMKNLLELLKVVCQERDEVKDQLQMLQNKIITSDQQAFNPANPSIRGCFDHVQLQPYNQGPVMIPNKPHSSITESNSLSDAYNHSSSPVDSFFDPLSSPEFSNVNVEKPFVQEYDAFSNGSNGLNNVRKVDQASLVMEGMVKGKTLPQKGNLLKAVMEAGPLLQTLLLAGPLPRWRNPPPLKAFHAPSIVAGTETTPMMVMKQSQTYAEMACGSSSMVGGGGSGGGGGVLSFGDGYFQGSMAMVAAYPGGGNLGSIGKRQRLH